MAKKIRRDIVQGKKILQQDGARSHTSKVARAYLRRAGMDYITEWPPNSPDMNMIELIWKSFHDAIGRQCPMTVKELKKAAQKAWKELPQKLLNRHILHFKKVLAGV